MANSPSGESMIARVVRLLSVFPKYNRPLSVREIAEYASLPVTTTHRLLKELEAEDLVTRMTDGGWQHGTRLWEIASRNSPVQSLRDAALPPMEDLVAGLRVHLSLAILDRNEVLYIERMTPNDYTVNIISVAGRLPAHATSAGLILHAFGSPDGRRLLLSRGLTKYTDTTLTEMQDLKDKLLRARHEGVVASTGAIIPESTGISVPVFGEGEYAIAALTAIVPIGQENLEVLVPQLRFAARAIRRRLGKTPDTDLGFVRETNPLPSDF
ncbi:IclR family transcriptional regulator [Corynebacterium crudilactis]|uniref:IclR family transcriptional regulator n=1 Tax=Corynebacterium crudilactis TaxID=1652495 RepID=A0A172QX43_9CORY|nr:IclR family transcriptional regulator [Corynebacterium crudilactis]ANE05200.1 IclR family transcriptional regulator [Corynebacterium crudilactis]